MSEMGILPRKQTYDFVNFNQDEFPIPYDKDDFPNGPKGVEISYENNIAIRAALYSSTGDFQTVSPNYLETLLEFIDDKLEKQQAGKTKPRRDTFKTSDSTRGDRLVERE